MTWHSAHRRLAARMDGAPALLRAAAAQRLPPLPFLPAAARAICVTGIGSSAAQAALLAHLLADAAGLPARAVPAGAFRSARADRCDALVVFSQGLSPNARLALHDAAGWLGVVLVTAAGRATDPARRASLAALRAAGGVVVPVPGGAERGLLLRVGGPLAASAIAFRLAEAIAAAGRDVVSPAFDVARVARAMRGAAAHAARLPADLLDGELVLLASGGYGALAANLALKLGEGLYAPQPPVWELLDFAHGPLQQHFARAVTFLALTRADAAGEAALLAHAAAGLDRRRHRLVALPATLPGALALFEHEALLNALVLRAIAARRLDQSRWPGQGREQRLYDVATPAPRSTVAERAAHPPAAALATATWQEIATALRAGRRTAVVPLGATEQHGPHLPGATDTWIAAALAERFCARVPEALALPPLPFGCSAEHAAFPGTLTLRWETLSAVLADLVASLARQGFERVLIFSAHGGNDALLRAAAPALHAAGRPARLVVCAGLDALARRWRAASAAHGIDAAASGQHAGEFETSIILGLRPQAVRHRRLRRGAHDAGGDPQDFFYPDLRAVAPSGVVGDPRRAAAPRAAAYLDVWVDALVAAYRAAARKKRQNTNGTQAL